LMKVHNLTTTKRFLNIIIINKFEIRSIGFNVNYFRGAR
jgi:hypothetical protein